MTDARKDSTAPRRGKTMTESTRRALVELNRRFYSRFAASFNASRERPWPGWDRLLRHVPGASRRALRVLDVGCGNGRFASYLAERVAKLEYVGIDGSAELLRLAGERLGEAISTGRLEATWVALELTGGELRQRLGDARFDLVVTFGVLHHIPGRAHRASFLAELAAHVAPGGHLSASVWRFDRLPRRAAKVQSWDDYNHHAAVPIDVTDLEGGDCLLTWAGDRADPRYCHLIDGAEVLELAAACGLPVISRFTADGPGGDDNLYLVFENPGHRRVC